MANSDLTQNTFDKISEYVMSASGIHLSQNKFELVNTRLSKVIRKHNFSGFNEYYKYLIQDESGEAINELMNAISTNLTAFYREPIHFDYMKQVLLPDLIASSNSTRKYKIRGWSAGCSHGAEVYTIAMTLLDSIPNIENWDVKLLATDIDTNVLKTGQNGIYSEKQIEGVPDSILSSYFQYSQTRDAYRIKPYLRNLVKFRYLNLIDTFPFNGQFDFIFCRNVMIYFTKETQQELITKFYNYLKPGGYLFIGHSEGLSGLNHKYKYIRPTIYKKK